MFHPSWIEYHQEESGEMQMKTRGQFVQPNPVVARKEMERQESRRLRRLSEVGPSQAGAFGPSRRPPRPHSRPPSAPPGPGRPAAALTAAGDPRQNPGLYHVAAAYGAAAAAGVRRARSEVQPQQAQAAVLMSPSRRIQEARQHLQVTSEAEELALAEELQSWYFGSPEIFPIEDRGALALLQEKPPVNALEDAAAAMKAKATGASDFQMMRAGFPPRPPTR